MSPVMARSRPPSWDRLSQFLTPKRTQAEFVNCSHSVRTLQPMRAQENYDRDNYGDPTVM